MLDKNKKGVIFNKLTGEVLYDPEIDSKEDNIFFDYYYNSPLKNAVLSFIFNKRYEKNDKASMCDGIKPKTVAELYDYFVSNGNIPAVPVYDYNKDDDSGDIVNNYEDFDDLQEKKQYYDDLDVAFPIEKTNFKKDVKVEATDKVATTVTSDNKDSSEKEKDS